MKQFMMMLMMRVSKTVKKVVKMMGTKMERKIGLSGLIVITA